jgi:hypothetical protein
MPHQALADIAAPLIPLLAHGPVRQLITACTIAWDFSTTDGSAPGLGHSLYCTGDLAYAVSRRHNIGYQAFPRLLRYNPKAPIPLNRPPHDIVSQGYCPLCWSMRNAQAKVVDDYPDSFVIHGRMKQ